MESIKAFIKLAVIYCAISLFTTLIIPSDPKNSGVFGLSIYRLVLICIFLFIIFLLLFVLVSLRNNRIVQKIINQFISFLSQKRTIASISFLIIHIILFLTLAFILMWIVFQDYSPYFIRLSPLFFFLMAIGIQSLFWIKSSYRERFVEAIKYLFQLRSIIQTYKPLYVFLYSIVFIFGCLYLYWGINHSILVNTNPSFSDQHSYLSIAKKAHDTGFQYHGDRNRMPIYPYLLALLYKADMSIGDLFELGKFFNVLFSFTLLICLWLIFQKSLSRGKAFLLTAIIGSSLFIYKSGYVQPELLFYFMFFVSYLLMLKMMAKPKIILGIITGIVLATTYLIKASVIPSMIIFLGLLFSKQLVQAYSLLRTNTTQKIRSISLTFAPSLVIPIMFILVLSPYLLENKALFGKYFYNVNSTFYIWYDSWNEVTHGTLAYGDMEGWPDLPDNKIPTMQKYLKEHDIQQMIDRFKSGWQNQVQNIITQYSYFNYPLIYSVVLIIFSAVNISGTLETVKKNIYQILLFVLIMTSNFILFAWYSPITNHLGARFTYGLYIPYLFSIFISINNVLKENSWKVKKHFTLKASQLLAFDGFNLIVIGLLMFEFLHHIPNEMAVGWFGK